MTVIFFFCIFRLDGISKGIDRIISILTPFIYGGVMAYLLKTPYNWIEKKLLKRLTEKRMGLVRALSVIIVLLLVAVIIFVLLSMVVPALANSIVSIAREIPRALTGFEDFISNFTTDNKVIDNYIKQAVDYIENNGVDWLKDKILPRLESMMGEFANAFSSILGMLYNLLLGIIICIYLLLGKSTFARQGKMLVYSVFKKDFAKKILEEFAFIDKTFVGFFGGKILDSAIVGLICYVFCLLMQFSLGMKNAVLIAVIVGVTNIIPFFGPYIGVIPSALIILIDSPLCCLIFVGFIIVLQQIDGNVLGPMLLSESVGLSGFWVLFSITAFGGLFGIVGILVGVPVFAVLYDLIKRWVYMMLRKHEVTEYLPMVQGDAEREGKEASRAEDQAGI